MVIAIHSLETIDHHLLEHLHRGRQQSGAATNSTPGPCQRQNHLRSNHLLARQPLVTIFSRQTPWILGILSWLTISYDGGWEEEASGEGGGNVHRVYNSNPQPIELNGYHESFVRNGQNGNVGLSLHGLYHL